MFQWLWLIIICANKITSVNTRVCNKVCNFHKLLSCVGDGIFFAFVLQIGVSFSQLLSWRGGIFFTYLVMAMATVMVLITHLVSYINTIIYHCFVMCSQLCVTFFLPFMKYNDGRTYRGIELAYVRCTCSGRRFVPYIPYTSKYINTRFPNICLILYIHVC